MSNFWGAYHTEVFARTYDNEYVVLILVNTSYSLIIPKGRASASKQQSN